MGPPIAAMRIISINPPPPGDAAEESESEDELLYDPDGPTLHRSPPSDVMEAVKAATAERDAAAAEPAAPTVTDLAAGDDEEPPASIEIPITSDSEAEIDVHPPVGDDDVPHHEEAGPLPTELEETEERAAKTPSVRPELRTAASRTLAETMLDMEEELEIAERRSEPGEEAEVSPEDVVSVESVPTRRPGESVMPIRTPSGPPPVSTPAVKAARPAPPPLPLPVPTAERPALSAAAPSPLAPPAMTEAATVRKRARPWWEELFNDDFIRTMAKVTEEQIAQEADFIEESLGVTKGAMLLDMGCGTGRHAIELTRRGYQVVGFDLSLAMLAKAADEAQDRSQKLNFVQGDMREMTFENTFDGIYSWNTSFGYFEEEKNAQVILNVRKALKQGGQFLLDVANRDFVVEQSPSLAWFEGEGCVCMDEMYLDFITSRMRVKRTMMMEDGRTKEIEYSIRVYTLSELGKLLHENGFRVAEVSGRTTTPGVFLGRDSPRTIVLSEKR